MAKEKGKRKRAITLGSHTQDKVTGFAGIATARTEYLYGSAQVLVEREGTVNGETKAEWILEDRLL